MAFGVGCICWPLRINNVSLKYSRNRFSACEVEEEDMPIFAAASETLFSVNISTKIGIRFKSNLLGNISIVVDLFFFIYIFPYVNCLFDEKYITGFVSPACIMLHRIIDLRNHSGFSPRDKQHVFNLTPFGNLKAVPIIILSDLQIN